MCIKWEFIELEVTWLMFGWEISEISDSGLQLQHENFQNISNIFLLMSGEGKWVNLGQDITARRQMRVRCVRPNLPEIAFSGLDHRREPHCCRHLDMTGKSHHSQPSQ